jgi:ABC-type nickel/cobalt efflux system permease component RcnA
VLSGLSVVVLSVLSRVSGRIATMHEQGLFMFPGFYALVRCASTHVNKYTNTYRRTHTNTHKHTHTHTHSTHTHTHTHTITHIHLYTYTHTHTHTYTGDVSMHAFCKCETVELGLFYAPFCSGRLFLPSPLSSLFSAFRLAYQPLMSALL